MSEYPIPPDLQEEYEEMKTCALRDSAEHYKDQCVCLIERISRLESENRQLREALEASIKAIEDARSQSLEAHYRYKATLEQARAALSRKESPND